MQRVDPARRRRFRFAAVANGLIIAAHGPVALALAALGNSVLAVGGASALGLLTLVRLNATVRECRRPVWVTRFVDEPIFAHWGASVFLLGLGLPVWGAAAIWPEAAAWSKFAAIGYMLCLGVSAWGVWGTRRRVRIRRIEVTLSGLGKAFDGYRVVHLTDLHIGSFDRLETGLSWVELANSLRGDLVAVTGDLVTSGTQYYAEVAHVLGSLRARDGVLVSMGNHDQWDEEALVAAIEKRGPRVLRNESTRIERGGDSLCFAGLGDAYSGQDDLAATLSRVSGVPTLLLSHYPTFFDEARRHGVALVLSGHTHGGQIGIPGFSSRFNVATAFGQRAAGLFEVQGAYLCVSAGLGTTGPPMRIGVRPEIVDITLRTLQANSAPPSKD